MAKVIVSSDEKESMRILRMLNNSSEEAFTLLNKRITDPFECLGLLRELLESNRQEADKLLIMNGLSRSDADKLLGYLYNKPAPAYFVVDDSMLGKMSNISYLGNWDFRKLYAQSNIDKGEKDVVVGLVKIFNMPAEAAAAMYKEISITPAGKAIAESISRRYVFYDGFLKGDEDGKVIYFENGMLYDAGSGKAKMYSQKRKKFIDSGTTVFYENGTAKEVLSKSGDPDVGVAVFKENDQYSGILYDGKLGQSLFSRLYFGKGRGLKYFEPFYADPARGIYVYKINWEAVDE